MLLSVPTLHVHQRTRAATPPIRPLPRSRWFTQPPGRSIVMSLRTCHCRGHAPRPALAPMNCAGNAAAEVAYVPPTRSLLLQLSRFPVSQLRQLQSATTSNSDADVIAAQSRYPHLAILLQRSASMRLHWAPPQLQPSSQGAVSGAATATAPSSSHLSSTDEVERSSGVALRLLGLSTAEHIASQQRAQLLAAARVRSGVDASPAASYPPAFGAPGIVRMELASNHLPLYLLASARRAALLADANPERRALASHCNEPVFLAPQGMDAGDATAASLAPFLPQPAALLQHHSSVPLVDRAQRGLYIQRIVRHVAHRLALSCAGSVPSVIAAPADSPTPPAHVLLLHLDAQSLLGLPPADAAGAAEHAHVALSFLDQLLAALMTQLQSPVPAFTPPTSSASFPPQHPHPSAAAAAAFPAALIPSSLAPTAPLQSASQLFSSKRLCPELMWGLVLDDDDVDQNAHQHSQSVVADPAAALRAQVLQSLRPVQSYRVQDGCVTAPSATWLTCSAFMYHDETTRMATTSTNPSTSHSSAAPLSPLAATPAAPLHGSLHLTHLLKEMLFKLGLGSKYGA